MPLWIVIVLNFFHPSISDFDLQHPVSESLQFEGMKAGMGMDELAVTAHSLITLAPHEEYEQRHNDGDAINTYKRHLYFVADPRNKNDIYFVYFDLNYKITFISLGHATASLANTH